MNKHNFLIYGAGAIGTYIGGSLALEGHRVVFIEQPSAMVDLMKRGLYLDLRVDQRRRINHSIRIDFKQSNVEIVSTLEAAIQAGPFTTAVFALKSYDTAPVLERMKPYAAQLPPVLCLQNGVDNEPAIAEALGADRVIYGTVTSSVGRKAVGDIVLERLRGVGIAGGNPLVETLVRDFDSAYLNARLYADASAMKWSKMLTNLIGNASTAILDMTPAQVLAHVDLYGLEMAMLREALAVMRAKGIRVVDLPGTPVRALALAVQLPAFIARPLMIKAVGGGRGGKMPSFHIDLHGGRGKSEVDWLNGAVVRAGNKLGIPTPVNRLLTETLQSLIEGRTELDEWAHQPDKLLSYF